MQPISRLVSSVAFIVLTVLTLGATWPARAAPDTATTAASRPAAHEAARRVEASRPLPPRRSRSTGVAAGATGGTPEASSRTPGGPPPDVKEGITIQIPSVKQ